MEMPVSHPLIGLRADRRSCGRGCRMQIADTLYKLARFYE
jgi:hypothetical protein